ATVAEVPRIRFLEGLKRIALLSADKSYAVKVSLAPAVLRIASQNPDLGEAKDEFEVSYSGKPVTVGFNARYLTDVLSVLEGDTISFDLNDDASPGVLHPTQDRGTLAVVMPMRV
ncbi:MAG TPA: DNA polymerase III subunit beta, partial [Myxococcaceae bacterium]|nr:DNA polymerase III subunit beta [Myxococcaceae bacterium]